MAASRPTPTESRRWLRPPQLTPFRMAGAMVVAVAADSIPWVLGPLGWTFLDELVDVAAMLGTMAALGFHVLLLPTFVLELLPVADLLPTWTGCVLAVIALRRRAEQQAARDRATPDGPTIPVTILEETSDDR